MSSELLLFTFFSGFIHAPHKAVPPEFGCAVARSGDLSVLVLVDWYVETSSGGGGGGAQPSACFTTADVFVPPRAGMHW